MALSERFGRLPFADLVNPIYATLNQLLAASGRPAEFPQIENGVGAVTSLRERVSAGLASLPSW